ncbi:phage head closure protein [Kosakonia sp. SMBL-WEM22]|uniref:phage head closure protein n=1 Tax=Kosakonia sp. SMBL-WEM22 TaxID=2725560 RepID=UPI0016595779|nr:phage head closure protein [Kosakonia sp. SMBL-WEM22]QNQ19416.1 phage head closure protein [Kosakonia sp. SMBL-WEM22]
MEPGRFRHRVTIQNSTKGRTPSGQPVEEWHDIAVGCPAEIKAISGRELIASGAEKAEATVRVWMRFRSDITAASRLLCTSGPLKGVILDVSGTPVPNSNGTRLEILCKQGVKP